MDTFDSQFKHLTKLITDGRCDEAVRLSADMLAIANESWTEQHNAGQVDPALRSNFANIAMAHAQSLQMAELFVDSFTTGVTVLWQMSLDPEFDSDRDIDIAVISILNSTLTAFLGSLPLLVPTPQRQDKEHADAILTYIASMLYARYQYAKTVDIEPVKLAYTILSDMRQYGKIESPDVIVPIDGKPTAVPAGDIKSIMPDLVGRAIALGFDFN